MGSCWSIFGSFYVECFLLRIVVYRKESIDKADEGQQVAVSVCDGRIFYDGSVVQEQRYWYCVSIK